MFSAVATPSQNIKSEPHPLVLQYLEALGLSKNDLPTKPTLEFVELLMAKHGATFDMTSLPANLGKDVKLDFENLATYLLTNRYGFCFHHNVTTYQALKQLGYDVHFAAGYIAVNAEVFNDVSTHIAILLNFQGKTYLVDNGWGGGILKPMCLDLKNDPGRFSLTKLSDNLYGFMDQGKTRHKFSSTPVVLKDFEAGLKKVMGPDHWFFKSIFFTRKKSGNVHMVLNRKYTLLDSKGVNRKEFEFGQPAQTFLKTFFSLSSPQLDHISQSTFVNSDVRKTAIDYKLPNKALKNIYSFLSVQDQKAAHRVSSDWSKASSSTLK
jgi:arylamine N-acetyltransferase